MDLAARGAANVIAERGAGAECNGITCNVDTTAMALRGAVFSHFMPARERAAVERNRGLANFVPGRYCAGFEYPSIIDGEQEFAIFWRTLPRDHVPWSLLLNEAGGLARRPSGRGFLPYHDGAGLILARDEAAWNAARGLLR